MQPVFPLRARTQVVQPQHPIITADRKDRSIWRESDGGRVRQTVLWLLLSVVLAAACGDRKSTGSGGQTPSGRAVADVGDCSLVMGWDPWEPYMYADVGGSVRGLDIELLTAVTEKADCELSFQKASWTELLERLRNGEIDVVAGASVTEARKEFAWFSNPYRRETFVLYVRDTEAPKYPSTVMYDLLVMGLKVGVVSDYVYGEEISSLQELDRFADQFVEVPIGELNYISLLDYQIDGFLEDPFVAATVLRKKGLDEDIEKHPLVIDSGAVRFMYSKISVSGDLVDHIDSAMSDLIADGTYQAILDKYSK